MTSRLLMPVRTVRTTGADRAFRAPDAEGPAREVPGSTRPTPILDLAHPLVTALVARVLRESEARGAVTDRARLQVAHGILVTAVRPVYSVEDRRRVSRTLRLGRGSCSQRMAVLEAVARSLGVETRVRGLLVDGTFWYPRFPKLRAFVPEEVLLAWPEFRLDATDATDAARVSGAVAGAGPDPASTAWVPIAELFTGLAPGGHGGGFTNSGAETLFEAVARTTVDWDAPAACAGSAPCDLSAHLRTDLGRFSSRDELFDLHGQTLCRPARTLAEPVLGRWSAGAAA
ncbi:transglutaminase domain-containing protein [Streptomyces sp. TLI_105]|uniref:transglutaminase domain-containing protein n=1 Tax=Streptomyces sp. TLI_105 TaxID=1881019 RepID=UPI00089A5725|nr:transglutaminase domain-containing protein [Streptomyces sp. TLI_105]SEC58047.1 Transglutaminase-like superfamily protein [Streptomyces sp. TLI_105]